MQFSAGVLEQRYPLRETGSAKAERHSIRYSDASMRQVVRLWRRFVCDCEADPCGSLEAVAQIRIKDSGLLELRAVAREFAAFSVAFHRATGHSVRVDHVGSALAMMYRHIDAVPDRQDRVICAGLVASALARTGLQVHLVADSEAGLYHPQSQLFDALALLDIPTSCVTARMAAGERRDAYRQSVVLLAARECAMDFLRDAINTPGSANAELQAARKLAGRLQDAQLPVMQGLPCAILLDADSILIDNARAPIVLTRDAAPVHDEAETARALEMAAALNPGEHYHLTGEGAEVALTAQGIAQLNAWCEQLGGLWQSTHVAQLMLGSAIASRLLIKPGIHYDIRDQKIRWLVQSRLVPGMAVYPETLLISMIESLEQCAAEKPKEVIARSSYQQLFRYYLHLCGTCHEVTTIRRELRDVYGLSCRAVWPAAVETRFQRAVLPGDRDRVESWLLSWARHHDTDSCSIISVADRDSAARVHEVVLEVVPAARDISALEGKEFADALQPGSMVAVTAAQIDHQLPWLQRERIPPLRAVTLHRSTRIAEDRRQAQWCRYLDSSLRLGSNWLVLGTDHKLFEGRATAGLQRRMKIGGSAIAGRLLESRIGSIQRRLARDFVATRRALSAHDEVMQGMLAFTGKGLYGD